MNNYCIKWTDGTNWSNRCTLWFLYLMEFIGAALSVFYPLNKLALSFLTFACMHVCEWMRFPKKKESGCVDSSVFVTLVVLPAIWRTLDKACLLQLGLKWGEMFNTSASAQTQDMLQYLGQTDTSANEKLGYLNAFKFWLLRPTIILVDLCVTVTLWWEPLDHCLDIYSGTRCKKDFISSF